MVERGSGSPYASSMIAGRMGRARCSAAYLVFIYSSQSNQRTQAHDEDQ
jgi:hypothetical protein